MRDLNYEYTYEAKNNCPHRREEAIPFMVARKMPIQKVGQCAIQSHDRVTCDPRDTNLNKKNGNYYT